MTKDEALRLALEALGWTDEWRPQGLKEEAITAIKEVLAQREQDGECKHCTDGCPACDAKKLPEQKPYAFEASMYSNDRMKVDPVTGIVSIGTPQRTWVRLTNEQYLEACKIAESGNYMVAFQRIQQWLMEKNT